MALIVNVPTGQVEGQFVVGVVDGDGENSKPHYLPARGSVVFTATAPYVPNPAATPNPVTMLKKPVVALLDNEGYLCTPTLMNPEIPGRRGIRLAATDNDSDAVKGWTWEATPQFVDEDGATIPGTIPTFTFALPGNKTVDLTTVVKVPSSPGIGVEHALTLTASATAAAKAAEASATASQAIAKSVQDRANAGEFRGIQGIPGPNTIPTQQAVADYMKEPGNLLSAAVNNLNHRQVPLSHRGPMGLVRAVLALKDTDLPAVGGRLNIGFAGSSTTEGAPTVWDKRWVTLLGKRLTKNPILTDAEAYAKRTTGLPAGINIINAGISGARSDNYLAGLRGTRLASANPRLIVHTIGSNDFYNNYTIADYKKYLLEAIDSMNAQITGPVSHLLVHSYQRYDFNPVGLPNRRQWNEFRDAMIEIADSRPDSIAFLDLSESFRGVGIPNVDPLGLMLPDKVHMNDYGHALYADLIGKALGLPELPVEPEVELVDLIADDFNRADGPLGVTPLGGKPWVASYGSLAISGNHATVTELGGAAGAGALVESGLSDCVVSVRASSQNQGPLARADSDGNGYYLMYSGAGGEYRIGKRTASSFVRLAGTGTSHSWQAGAVLSLEMRGTKLTAKVDGVTVLTVDDSTYSGTRHGLITAAFTGGTMEDFKVSLLPALLVDTIRSVANEEIAKSARGRTTTLVSDYFARPNGPAGQAPTGQTWTSATGEWSVDGGKLRATQPGTAVIDAGYKDVHASVSVRLDTTGPESSVGIFARAIGDSSRVGVFFGPTIADPLQVWVKHGALNGYVLSRPVPVVYPGENLLAMQIQGRKVSGWLNNILVVEYTLSATEDAETNFPGATYVGVRSGLNSLHTFKNFQVTTNFQFATI